MFDFEFNTYNSSLTYGYKQTENHKPIDLNNLYKINSNGFRGDEITGNEDLLIAGCSFTFGQGVPEEQIWAVQIANKLNLTYANLSDPGASIMLIIQSIFKYFKKYGNPKTLICLFPDQYRMSVPHVENKLVSLQNTNIDDIYYLFLKEFDKNVPLYSKIPHMAEHVIPKEIAEWLSIQYIHMLEQYCKSSNIKFLWSSWDNDFLAHLLNKKIESNIFNGLVDIEIDKWKRDPNKYFDIYIDENCHLELKNIYPQLFNQGGDTELGLKYSHWGIHKHTHIAEIFELELSK